MEFRSFCAANETFEKVASIGLLANMITYLITEYHLDVATGVSILQMLGAIANFMPMIGASLSDSYLGRFRVIALGTITTLLGMFMLWLTALIPQARPPCEFENGLESCSSPSSAQLRLLISSFVEMGIGAGVIRPCSMAFGADQFDDSEDPNNDMILSCFFNWYYASVGVSVVISVMIIVYIQDEFGWIAGFGIPMGLMLISTVMFFLGSSLFVKVSVKKNLFVRFGRVVFASWKKRHLSLPLEDFDGWYYLKGSKLVKPTNKLRCIRRYGLRFPVQFLVVQIVLCPLMDSYD
ncbi:hypothetical protein TIFTF001_019724 [Ficus carica]|uniref:Uncharacterized protein n=1 Tax=Ficus carica TaxID=3494 RepID=A0AA88A743_FICCA|nr:hypothetical protein TIFTF001_019724 [Ficus carica]